MRWEALHALRGRDVHVVGLASTEGAAMVRFLWSEGVRRLTVHDFQDEDSLETTFLRMHVGMPKAERRRAWSELTALPVARRFGPRYLEGIDAADAVFAGQAWYLYPPNLPRLVELRDAGVPFHTLTELYFDLWPAPILAVTGSNGKSTASRLAEAILRQGSGHITYAGNERRSVQALDTLRAASANDWLILEVSNRQLIEVAPKPRVGVITNVLPNHLDEHGDSIDAYAAVKRKLLACQDGADAAVLNADNPASVGLAEGLGGQVHWFSRRGPVGRGAWLDRGRIMVRREPASAPMDLGPIDRSRLRGAHNEENALAAVLAAFLAGADEVAIDRGLRAFRGLRHRVQFVWGAGGVEYYDDLNATTPQATAAAIQSLDGPIVLIGGGDDKGLDYTDLATLIGERVRHVILLPGPGSDRLEAAVRAGQPRRGAPTVGHQDTLRAAVAEAVAVAQSGDNVLLSPACPYFFRLHYLDANAREVGFRSLLRDLTADGNTDGEERRS